MRKSACAQGSERTSESPKDSFRDTPALMIAKAGNLNDKQIRILRTARVPLSDTFSFALNNYFDEIHYCSTLSDPH